MRKTTHPQARKHQPNRTFIHDLETRQLLSAVPNVVMSPNIVLENSSATYVASGGYSPAQIRAAYGFSSVSFASGTSTVAGLGQGQTIAIVDAYNDPNIAHDLSVFDSTYGLASAPSFKVVNESGGSSLPASNAGWAGEISLDVEWAHAIAPDANILLVEANSSSLNDLMAGVNYARNAAGVSVVSMSWGGSEFYGENQYDSYFTTPAGHQGVTFVAASGDSGQAYGPEWPAVSPNVVSVGGTSLTLQNSSGTYSSESAWADSTGGTSQVEPMPSYQSGIPSTYTSSVSFSRFGGYSVSSNRSAPDVAYDANPSTGFAVYDSVAYEGYSGWEEIGGTSAGAPQWAALVAIADQGRALKGLGTLNGTSQTLPDLYSAYANPGTAGYSSYTSVFNDITSGGTYFGSATAGYDSLTGLGSPHASQVITLLTSSTTGTVTSTATATSTPTATRVRVARQDIVQTPVQDVAPAAAAITASATPLQTWAGLTEHFALADTAPAVMQRAGDSASPWKSPLTLASVSGTPPASEVSRGLSSLVQASAAAVQAVVSTDLFATVGPEVIPSGVTPGGMLAHGDVLSKLGSLFSASPIGGLALPEASLLPPTVLGLSPASAAQKFEDNGWEMTAVGSLGAVMAGCWYLHASRRQDEADEARAKALRVRQAGPGWELTPFEER